MIKDEYGADTLPMAFVTTMLIAAIIVGIAAAGIKNASPVIDTGSADAQANSLAADCQALLSCAPRYLEDPGSPAGATKLIQISLPDATEYFGLGYDPASGKGDSGIIYYCVAGGKKAIVVDRGVLFMARGDGTVSAVLKNEPIVLHGGRYKLEIEYACDAAGNRYLLVGEK